MKLKNREVFVFIGVISIALALPLSIWLVMKSQETRSRAGEVKAYVSPSIVQNGVCPADKVGYSLGCYNHVNTAIQAAQALGEAKTVIETESVADWANAYDWQMVIGERTVNNNEYEILIKNATDGVSVKIHTKTNSGNGHVVHVDDPKATVNIGSLELKSDLTNSIIHAYNAKALNLSYVGVYDGKAAGVYYDSASTGTVSDSTFIGNYWPGVSVHGSSKVTINNSTFNNHQHAGADVTDTATLKIRNSNFDNNGLAFVEADSSWNSTNHPHEVDADGNYYTAGSILAKKNSRLEISKSTVTNTNATSIRLGKGGLGSVEDFVEANLFDNTITTSKGSAVFVTGETIAEILNSLLLNNNAQGVYITNFATVELVNNTIIGNINSGIDSDNCTLNGVERNPVVIAVNNVIKGNRKTGGGSGGFGISGFCMREPGALDGDIYLNNLIWGNEGDGTDCDEDELCITDPINLDVMSFDPRLLPTQGYQHEWKASDALTLTRPWNDPTEANLLSELVVNKGATSYTNFDNQTVTLANPDGTAPDLGAWGGSYTDWAPVFTKDLEYTCEGGFTVGYKDYNDLSRKYTGISGALYEKLSEGNYKHWANATTTGSTTDNVTIEIPAELRDGKDHILTFAAHNLYNYTDLDNEEVYVKQDNTLGVFMHQFTPEVTFNCGVAANTPPRFVTEVEDQLAYIGQVFTYGIEFTDDDGDETILTATIPGELTGWLGKSAESTDGNLILTGTPTPISQKGVFEIDLELKDGKDVVKDSFTLTVADNPADAVLLSLRINLQTKTDESNERVLVKLIDNAGKIVYQATTASNADGFVSTLALSGLSAGDYTIWVKPRGYLSRKVTRTLVVGENKMTVPEEFLVGDIDEGISFNIIKAADYSILIAKYFQEDCGIRNLDGNCMVNAKDVSLMYGNWFKQGDPI